MKAFVLINKGYWAKGKSLWHTIKTLQSYGGKFDSDTHVYLLDCDGQDAYNSIGVNNYGQITAVEGIKLIYDSALEDALNKKL